VTLMTANSSFIIQGPAQNGGRGRWSGARFAEIIVPSGSAMPIRPVFPSGTGAKIR